MTTLPRDLAADIMPILTQRLNMLQPRIHNGVHTALMVLSTQRPYSVLWRPLTTPLGGLTSRRGADLPRWPCHTSSCGSVSVSSRPESSSIRLGGQVAAERYRKVCGMQNRVSWHHQGKPCPRLEGIPRGATARPVPLFENKGGKPRIQIWALFMYGSNDWQLHPIPESRREVSLRRQIKERWWQRRACHVFVGNLLLTPRFFHPS
jgi:hypothetical protein